MAAVYEDFFTGDDLEAILDIIEGDFVEESEEFNADIGALLSDIDPESVAVNFPCEHCDKTCKTKFIQNGASKLALDECYSEKFRKEFSSYVVTYDDALFSYQFVRDLIGCFNGDLEKFYPTFYKCVSSDENAFKNLSRRSSRILGYEVANHVVAHLTGSFVKESGSGVELRPNVSFTEKESDIIKYLSGYVFGTIYRRIRLSKSAQSMLGFQSLSILLAFCCLLMKAVIVINFFVRKIEGDFGLLVPTFTKYFHRLRQIFDNQLLVFIAKLIVKR